MPERTNPKPTEQALEKVFDAGLKLLSADDLKPRTSCPDSETFALYVQGQIDTKSRRAINQHIAFCRDCYQEYLVLAEPDDLHQQVDRELQSSEVVGHGVGSPRFRKRSVSGDVVRKTTGRMTTTQLVRHLAAEVKVSNPLAFKFLQVLTDTAITETRDNGFFVLPGLGRMTKVWRKARWVRNPQTGKPIWIPAQKTAKFLLFGSVKNALAPRKKQKKGQTRVS